MALYWPRLKNVEHKSHGCTVVGVRGKGWGNDGGGGQARRVYLAGRQVN
jgi:hypothetical protein